MSDCKRKLNRTGQERKHTAAAPEAQAEHKAGVSYRLLRPPPPPPPSSPLPSQPPPKVLVTSNRHQPANNPYPTHLVYQTTLPFQLQLPFDPPSSVRSTVLITLRGHRLLLPATFAVIPGSNTCTSVYPRLFFFFDVQPFACFWSQLILHQPFQQLQALASASDSRRQRQKA